MSEGRTDMGAAWMETRGGGGEGGLGAFGVLGILDWKLSPLGFVRVSWARAESLY